MSLQDSYSIAVTVSNMTDKGIRDVQKMLSNIPSRIVMESEFDPRGLETLKSTLADARKDINKTAQFIRGFNDAFHEVTGTKNYLGTIIGNYQKLQTQLLKVNDILAKSGRYDFAGNKKQIEAEKSLRSFSSLATSAINTGNIASMQSLIDQNRYTEVARNINILESGMKRIDAYYKASSEMMKAAEQSLRSSGNALRKTMGEIFAGMDASKLSANLPKIKAALDKYVELVSQAQMRVSAAMKGQNSIKGKDGHIIQVGGLEREMKTLNGLTEKLSKIRSAYSAMQRQNEQNIASQKAFSKAVINTVERMNSLRNAIKGTTSFNKDSFLQLSLKEQDEAMKNLEARINSLLPKLDKLQSNRLAKLGTGNMNENELRNINTEIDKLVSKYKELTAELNRMRSANGNAKKELDIAMKDANKSLASSSSALKRNASEIIKGISTDNLTIGLNNIKEKLLSYEAQIINARRRLQAAMRGESVVTDRNGALMPVGSIQKEIALLNNLTQRYSSLKALMRSMSGEHMERVAASTRSAENATRQYLNSLNAVNAKMHETRNIASDLRSEMINMFSLYGIKQFLQNIVDIGGQFEYQRKAIATILNSETRANDLFNRVKDLGLKSPLSTLDIDKYVKQMSAFDIPYSQLFEKTKKLADIAAGTGADMSRIILAYGHVKSGGYLTGIQNRQFTNANINMVGGLSKMYSEREGRSVPVSEVYKRMEKRQVTFEDMDAVLMKMAEEGGQFYNMQEEMAETTKGKWKNVTDAINHMFYGLEESSGGVLKLMAEGITKLAKLFESQPHLIYAMVAAYGALKLSRMANVAAMGKETAATFASIQAEETRFKKMLAFNRSVTGSSASIAMKGNMSMYSLNNMANVINGTDAKASMDMKAAVLKAGRYGKLNKEALIYLMRLRAITKEEARWALSGATWAGKMRGFFNSISAGIVGMGKAMGAFMKSNIYLFIIFTALEGIIKLWDKFSGKAQNEANAKAFDRLKESIDRVNEALKNIVNLEFDKMDLSQVVDRINEMMETIREETGYGELLYGDIFKVGNDGKYLMTEVQQAEELRDVLKDIKSVKDELASGKSIALLSSIDNDDWEDYKEEVQEFIKDKSESEQYLKEFADTKLKNPSYNTYAVKQVVSRYKNFYDVKKYKENFDDVTATALALKKINFIENNIDTQINEWSNKLAGMGVDSKKRWLYILEEAKNEYAEFGDEFMSMFKQRLAHVYQLSASQIDQYKRILPSWLKSLQKTLDENQLHIDIKMSTDAVGAVDRMNEELKNAYDKYEKAYKALNGQGKKVPNPMSIPTNEGPVNPNIEGNRLQLHNEMIEAAKKYQGLVNAAGSQNIFLSLPWKEEKSNKKNEDVWLKNMRNRIDLIKKAYQSYKKWVKEFGKERAREEVKKSPEFSTLFTAEEWKKVDWENYSEMIQDILDKNATAFNQNAERVKLKISASAEIQDIKLTNEKEKLDQAINTLEEYFSRRNTRLSVYEDFMKYTNNQLLSSVFAFGANENISSKRDWLISDFNNKIKSLGVTEDFATLMTFSEEQWEKYGDNVRKVFENIKKSIEDLDNAQQKAIIDIIGMDKSQAAATAAIYADLYDKKVALLEQYNIKKSEIDKSNLSNEEKENAKNALGNIILEATLRIDADASMKALEEELKSMDFDNLLQYLPYNDMMGMVAKIGEELVNSFNKGLIKFDEFADRMRKLKDQMLGLDFNIFKPGSKMSMMFDTLQYGFKGALDRVFDRALLVASGKSNYDKKDQNRIMNQFSSLFGNLSSLFDMIDGEKNANKTPVYSNSLDQINNSLKDILGEIKSLNGKENVDEEEIIGGEDGNNNSSGSSNPLSNISSFISSIKGGGAGAGAGAGAAAGTGAEVGSGAGAGAGAAGAGGGATALMIMKAIYLGIKTLVAICDGFSEALKSSAEMAEARGKDEKAYRLKRASQGFDVISSNLDPGSEPLGALLKGDLSGTVKGLISAPVRTFTQPITKIAEMHDSKINHKIERSVELMKELQNEYKNIERAISRYLGVSDTYLSSTYENLKLQMEEAKKQWDLAEKKKNKDEDQLREYEQQYEDLADKVKWYWYDTFKDLYGIDFSSYASRLGNALRKAFEDGSNAAYEWKKEVGDIIRDLATEIGIQRIIGPQIDKIMNKYFGENGIWNGKTNFTSYDMAELANDLGGLYEAVGPSLEQWMTAVDKIWPYSSSDETTGSLQKLGQNLTEETGGIIASYLNAMRADLSYNRYNLEKIIQEGLPALLTISTTAYSQLEQLRSISYNTQKAYEILNDLYSLQRDVTLGVRKFYVN